MPHELHRQARFEDSIVLAEDAILSTLGIYPSISEPVLRQMLVDRVSPIYYFAAIYHLMLAQSIRVDGKLNNIMISLQARNERL